MVILQYRMEKIQLRDVAEGDLPVLFEFQREAEANQMADFPARTREDFVAHWKSKMHGDPGTVQKAIVAGGVVVGDIVAWEHDGKHLVGYWIGKEYWGKGIATRALAEFLSLITARPLHAFVAAHNVASIRVLEKCGFRVFSRGMTHSEVQGREIEDLLMRLSKLPICGQVRHSQSGAGVTGQWGYIKMR